jgi:UDP-N-acetylglucosamine diphosphorylase/glucosamine-1-phosphate N-acetyltransferase
VKAVILAAGEGNRMRPLTYTRPKVMLPIANKPIMEHLLIAVEQSGIRDFIFIVGYQDDRVRDYFGNGDKWGVNISYRLQRCPMGTADALRLTEGLVDDCFLVLNGDIIVDCSDIKSLVSRGCTSLSVKEVKNTVGLGVVEIADGYVTRLHEKSVSPPTNLANTGVYLFTRSIFEAISRTPKSQRGEYELPQSIQLLIDGGEKVACHPINSWLDVSYPWDLLGLNGHLLSNLVMDNHGIVEENAVIRGVCCIGEGSRIRSGSYIVGPVIIGNHCDVGPNCYIRPSTSIGDNCHIGAAVEVKNSIIMNGSKVPHHNYVGDSIIGEHCNLGAGTKIANLRFDETNVIINGIDTSLRKFGAVLGDNVESGINASINIGTVIGNNTHIGPGAIASGVIAPKSRIF